MSDVFKNQTGKVKNELMATQLSSPAPWHTKINQAVKEGRFDASEVDTTADLIYRTMGQGLVDGNATAEAWSSLVVGYFLEKTGYKSTRRTNARSYMDLEKALFVDSDKAKHGDLVVLWSGDPRSPKGFVGFYVGEDFSYINVLGGHEYKKVDIRNYPRNRVLAIIRPRKAK